MDPEYLIVLYSKYSQNCQKILQVYNKSTMDYIKMVCIDNSAFRTKLAVSKSLNVKTVPCVLLMYPGNKVEKFEGQGVTEWVLQQISQNLPDTKTVLDVAPPVQVAVPQQQQQQVAVPQQQQQVAVPQQQQQVGVQHFTDISDLNLEDDQEIYERQPTSQEQMVSKPKSVSEMAAEMAAEREGADKPAHLRKQEMEQVRFSGIP